MTGKGFNNTPNAGEYRRYSSWGRTRSPKNIISDASRKGDASGNGVTVIAGEESAGYITQNQRYLHITHTAAAAGGTIQVWGRMKASNVWAKIGSAITTSDTAIHSIVETQGVDEVKVSAAVKNVTLFLACSTF